MTLQQGQLQALITEMEALLGKAAPKLPWGRASDPSEQRQLMEQALAYLKQVQQASEQRPDFALEGGNASIAPPDSAPSIDPATPATAADSQRVLQTLLQEMQYLRAQMVQPLTSEVLALQQQREALKNEVQELEAARSQQTAATDASQTQPVWLDSAVAQLRASLMRELAPQLRRLQSPITADPALSATADGSRFEDETDLPQLTPPQRLEQLRQIQSQTDYMLLQLDSNLRAVFESLEQSIQSYCDTLSRGLDTMHGLGQQGEFVFRAFINHLAEQLQEESASVSSQLARRQEMARLQGQLEEADVDSDISSEELDEAPAIANFEDIDLNDLADLDIDSNEEVTLFQLDEEFNDLALDAEDVAIAADENWQEADDGEPTIVQTEPMDWAIATGQAEASTVEASSSDDDVPPVVYDQEIDALYDSLFGSPSEADSATIESSVEPADADAAIAEQLLSVDTPIEVSTTDAADATVAPRAAEPPPMPSSPSLDLDFLLESDAPDSEEEPAADTAATTDAPLADLLGAEIAADLAPTEPTSDDQPDRITALTDLLPASERTYGARQADPFAAFDELGDAFIPAPPNEDLLNTDSEILSTQVELDLDDATLDQLNSDLSRLEGVPVAATDGAPPTDSSASRSPDVPTADLDNFTLDDIWGSDAIAAEIAPLSAADDGDRGETVTFDEALGTELDRFADQGGETESATPPTGTSEAAENATVESLTDLPTDDLDPLAERAEDFSVADLLPPMAATDETSGSLSEQILMSEPDTAVDDLADLSDVDLSFDELPELAIEPTNFSSESIAGDSLAGDLSAAANENTAVEPTTEDSTIIEALQGLAEASARERLSQDQQSDALSPEASESTSAFTLTGSATTGLSLVSSEEETNAALLASLAALPEDSELAETVAMAESTSESLPAATPFDETTASLLPTAFDISGSSETGYTLNLEADDSAAAINQTLLAAPDPELTEPTTDAIAATEFEQLGRQYGRRLLSLADMVPATQLPFSEPVDLYDLPDLNEPVETASGLDATAVAADSLSAEESELIVLGSVEAGFVVTLPAATPSPADVLNALPDDAADSPDKAVSDAAADENDDLADANIMATDFDELAQRVSPIDSMEAEALAAGTPSFASPEMEDLMAADFAQAAANMGTSEAMSSETISDDETSAPLTADELAALFSSVDEATSAAASEASALPVEGLDSTAESVSSADSFDQGPDENALLADAPLTAAETADVANAETAGLFDHIDLSMEEIPDEQIETDIAFQSTFADLDLDRLTPELDAAVAESSDAIADQTARIADSPAPTVAREETPAVLPQPDDSPDLAAADVDDALFASSGQLTTLGDADLGAGSEADEDGADGLGKAWFLGIDFGTTGLSAVLMEQHSGQAHPLCWVTPDAEATDQPPNFRMPAVAAWTSALSTEGTSAELLGVGQPALTMAAESSDAWLLDALRSHLRTGIPYETADGRPAPLLQWSESQTIDLPAVMSMVQALLQLIGQAAADVDLQLDAIGLEADQLDAVLAQLQGVIVGMPTNWSDTYCFNLREAVLATGLVESPDQIFFIEEAIATALSGLPDPSEPPLEQNRQVQTLYECSWQGGTVVIGSGAVCTEVGILDIPQPLDALSREDFYLRNLPYGGDALDLDIICQLLIPPERRQSLAPGARRRARQGWDWQAALPDVTHAQWADLQIEALNLPQLAEPDIAVRQRLRQHLASSALGQSLLEAARHLKLILQNQNQYQLELADQSWRVQYRDLESRVLLPYIQRINQQVNALLSQTGLASQGVNQVICTGGNASFSTIAKWLRQKFPNATIIQDTYPSQRPQTCSRVAYGLVNLCRYPQVLDMARHQYSDYFLLHEMLRIMPDAPLPFDGILHLLEQQGINTEVCRSRIAAILEGHLPPGLLPDAATEALLSRVDWMAQSYRGLTAANVFSQTSRNIYTVNPGQRDRLRDHLMMLLQHKQQSLAEPLIAQLVAVY